MSQLLNVNIVFLTEKQLASRWGLSQKVFQNRRSQGRDFVSCFKFGASVRYKLADILLYEEKAKNCQSSFKGDKNDK